MTVCLRDGSAGWTRPLLVIGIKCARMCIKFIPVGVRCAWMSMLASFNCIKRASHQRYYRNWHRYCKEFLQLNGANAHGKGVLKRRLTSEAFLPFMAKLSKWLVGLWRRGLLGRSRLVGLDFTVKFGGNGSNPPLLFLEPNAQCMSALYAKK